MNCVRSLPWVRAVHSRYAGRGLSAIGIHSPELDYERPRAAVERFIRDNDITWPQLLDVDHAYWNALSNSYWPTFYLIDRQGRIRGRYVGETHAGDPRARVIEAAIEGLLEEQSHD